MSASVGLDPRVTGAACATPTTPSGPGMLHAAFVRSPLRARARARGRRVGACRPGAWCSRRRRRRRSASTAARSRTSGCSPTSPASPATSWRRWPRPTREAAQAAARAIEVESRSLAGRLRPRRGRRARARRCCTSAGGSARDAVSIDVRPIAGSNVCHRFLIRQGDAAAAMARADVVVEEVFRTPSAAHAPMEPHATLAEWEDGRLTLWTATQTPFNVRADLAGVFGLRRRRRSASSRRRWAAPSGPRPSSAWRPSWPRWRARPARRSRRCWTATEEFVTLNRHPATMRVRIGAHARRHARGQGARLLGRHRRLRRLRPGRRHEAGLRRGRPVPDPATCAWTRSPSTRTCRPTAPTAATARCSRCGRRSAPWTCSPRGWT